MKNAKKLAKNEARKGCLPNDPTYLENNGPAALHVADGKDVDLNRLFKEVVG